MKILVLGGTKFLGSRDRRVRARAGHDVTLFNRGETNPDSFGSRRSAATGPRISARSGAGSGTRSSIRPAISARGRRVAEALKDSVGRYLFVSSVSVYADLSKGPNEDSPRAGSATSRSTRCFRVRNYGALKALCEDAVWEVYGDRATIVRRADRRAHHDPAGRFTYWPHRAHAAAGWSSRASGTVQFVDVRDLGRWLVELLGERDEGGAFNATRSAVSWRS